MTDFEYHREFELRWRPRVVEIIEGFGLEWKCRFASDHEDRNEATDLVLVHSNKRVMSRVRRRNYIVFGPYQLTIRKTELPKVMSGFGDLMFYGAVDAKIDGGDDIVHWWLLNMDAFREGVLSGIGPIETKSNTDGSGPFYAYDIRDWKTKAKLHFVQRCKVTHEGSIIERKSSIFE